ncbi:MAG: methyltransferase, partial [Candidatus Humimicrobiaceae bacterium]
QVYNYLGLFALMTIVVYSTNWAGVCDGELWGPGTIFWFWLSIATGIVHQFCVWFFWRTELHLKLISKWFGRRAFLIWTILFNILFVSRFLFVFLLGYANRGTWDINPIFGYVLSFIILIPAIYTFYSVKKYFTLKRALGIDHFDTSYRKLGLVREGIFKYTPNAMYIFGVMIVWIPALIFASKAALISALFNHAYLWVHYYTLELPDMKRIYVSR